MWRESLSACTFSVHFWIFVDNFGDEIKNYFELELVQRFEQTSYFSNPENELWTRTGTSFEKYRTGTIVATFTTLRMKKFYVLFAGPSVDLLTWTTGCQKLRSWARYCHNRPSTSRNTSSPLATIHRSSCSTGTTKSGSSPQTSLSGQEHSLNGYALYSALKDIFFLFI